MNNVSYAYLKLAEVFFSEKLSKGNSILGFVTLSFDNEGHNPTQSA